MQAYTISARRVLAIGLFTLALALGSARAASADAPVHTVQPGENLFRIGLRYGVSWQAILQANGLADTTIYAGQQLLIPVAGESAPAPAAAPAAPAPAASSFTYIVQPGDTLFRIATRYGLTWAEVAAANGLANPSLIYAGQALVIPAAGAAVAVSPPAPAGGSAGKRILVDLSEQHLYAYQDGLLVYSFTASTGAPGMETRPGRYAVQNKIPNAYGGNWNIWMPNWLGIYWAGYLQNGIHALPVLPGGGRLWDGYLGTPVSYGCVILGINEAQLLYDWAEVGTPVDIQD